MIALPWWVRVVLGVVLLAGALWSLVTGSGTSGFLIVVWALSGSLIIAGAFNDRIRR